MVSRSGNLKAAQSFQVAKVNQQIQGRCALWPAKEGVRYAMSGKVTLPVEVLTELVVIAGDARSEVELGIVLWDNSSSNKPNAPRFSGYANLPAEPQQQAPKAPTARTQLGGGAILDGHHQYD